MDAAKAIPGEIEKMRIEIDEFIDLYNRGEAERTDIRVPYETDVWQVEDPKL